MSDALIDWEDFAKVDLVRGDHAYPREELLGRLVLAVVNFPARQIGPFWFDVLTLGLGTYRREAVLLVTPEPQAQPGDRLG
jgi:tRNA-binding protein